ncbi:MAG: protein kinase [Myxococcales bacterium]|nr:protein kinase [Myxococcales bacterium]
MAEGLGAPQLRTKSDVLMGTPTYMSPEQCRGAKLATDRSDVYSLGVLLYQMLAGYPPFLGASMGDLIAMHLMDEPPPLSDAVPSLSPKTAKLVYAMLAKKPESRPSMDKAQQALVRLEEVTPASQQVAYLRRKPEPTDPPPNDSQQKTVDVPASPSPVSPSPVSPSPVSPSPVTSNRAKPNVEQLRALSSGMVSDSRHVRIPKRTLAMFLGAFVTSTLIVTTGILLGTQSQRGAPHRAPITEQTEPSASAPAPAPASAPASAFGTASPDSAAPQVTSAPSSSMQAESVSAKAERSATASKDAVTGKHIEPTHAVSASGKPRAGATGSEPSASEVSANGVLANGVSASLPIPSVPVPVPVPVPIPVPKESSQAASPSTTASTNSSSAASTSSPSAASASPPTTASTSAQTGSALQRGSDDPFNPLRTAEDYLLQGSYRRAMDLATQFGKQEPMRAWEIYGRAACGLRWMERAQRALRELQQHHEDRRAQSLVSYCLLHKLPLAAANY